MSKNRRGDNLSSANGHRAQQTNNVRADDPVRPQKQNAITLIALVITIIVLLILAGVALSLVMGENGITERAVNAGKTQNIAGAKEKLELDVANYASEFYQAKYVNGSLPNGVSSMLEYIMSKFNNGPYADNFKIEKKGTNQIVLTSNTTSDNTTTATATIESDGKVSWSGTETSNSEGNNSSVLTIGSVYTDDMIGQSITYSANGCSEWIVIGPELDASGNRTGNVLITSKDPIADGFTLNGTAKAWLYYDKKSGETGYDETDDSDNPLSLNKACSVYSGTIQGKTVNARSITLQDINYAVGFTEPTDFKTYTFGTTHGYDFDNEEWTSYAVDYYYPSLLGANRTDSIPKYFVKAGETLESTIPSQNFKANCYIYFNDGEGCKFAYENTGWEYTATTLTRAENMRYVIGETGENFYYVASRSVDVLSSIADFRVAQVFAGSVRSNDGYVCSGYSDGAVEGGESGTVPVRPVAVLPSDIEVEEVSSGIYDIVQE